MAIINMRVDEKLKKDAEHTLNELGLNMTTAITVFLKAVVREQCIPFNIEIPNKTTLKAMKEVEDMISGKKKSKSYSSVEELRKDLENEI